MKDRVLAKVEQVKVSAVVERPAGFARELSVTELGLVSGGLSVNQTGGRTVTRSVGDGGYGDDCLD